MDQDSLPLSAQTMTEPCAEAVLFPPNASQTRQKRRGRRAGGRNFMPEWLSEVARWPTCRTRGLASRRPGRCSWLKATPCRCTSVTLNMLSCSQTTYLSPKSRYEHTRVRPSLTWPRCSKNDVQLKGSASCACPRQIQSGHTWEHGPRVPAHLPIMTPVCGSFESHYHRESPLQAKDACCFPVSTPKQLLFNHIPLTMMVRGMGTAKMKHRHSRMTVLHFRAGKFRRLPLGRLTFKSVLEIIVSCRPKT